MIKLLSHILILCEDGLTLCNRFKDDLSGVWWKRELVALERVKEIWAAKYGNSMKCWKDNWDAISPFFKFSTTVRKVIYMTNDMESLNWPTESFVFGNLWSDPKVYFHNFRIVIYKLRTKSWCFKPFRPSLS